MTLSTLLLTLSLALGTAYADEEVAPMNSATQVLVMGPSGETVMYPLDAGTTLDFDTPGPTRLVVEVRRRFATDAASIEPASIDALGDGTRIMSVRVAKGPQKGGTIFDAKGGFVSVDNVEGFPKDK